MIKRKLTPIRKLKTKKSTASGTPNYLEPRTTGDVIQVQSYLKQQKHSMTQSFALRKKKTNETELDHFGSTGTTLSNVRGDAPLLETQFMATPKSSLTTKGVKF
jgi:hypothetical protein